MPVDLSRPSFDRLMDAVDDFLDALLEFSNEDDPKGKKLNEESVVQFWSTVCLAPSIFFPNIRMTKEIDGNRSYILVEQRCSLFCCQKQRESCIFVIQCSKSRENISEGYWEGCERQLAGFIRQRFKCAVHISAAIAIGSVFGFYHYQLGGLQPMPRYDEEFDILDSEDCSMVFDKVFHIFLQAGSDKGRLMAAFVNHRR
ncbi:hypothetical protein LOZ58_002733 [Ophidiomyces ophidiicola]|nr:hypothetical protein LOZ58_002733 [Ophidiomyces ophidiicola]